jgi:hypothetical protein
MDVGLMAFHQCIHKSPSFKGASKFQVLTSLCLLLMALLKLPSNFKVKFFSSTHDTNINEEISINTSLWYLLVVLLLICLNLVHLKFQLASHMI